MKFKLLTIALIALMIGCATSGTSVIVSSSYNEEKNATTLTLAPYGQIKMPGEWAKTSYNEVSRQHFFIDADSTSIAVAKNPQKQYPFYNETTSDKDFARKFYTWEKEFYEKKGFEIKENIAGENFVVWTVNGENTNTIFLYGAKKPYAYNFAVFTNNWSEEKRTEFLQGLFEKN